VIEHGKLAWGGYASDIGEIAGWHRRQLGKNRLHLKALSTASSTEERNERSTGLLSPLIREGRGLRGGEVFLKIVSSRSAAIDMETLHFILNKRVMGTKIGE
jgi:hypothetical protein